MTKIINLADLKKPAEVVIIIDGIRHEMKNPSVEDFIANTEAVQKLGIKSSPLDEILTMIDMVIRAFPTLTSEQVKSWPMDYIHQISEMARGGEVSTEAGETSGATGNDQPAT